ncbi:UDP-N-acetylglucosamine--N-acetylmuramyl-(pentapeptide) pyrophosphoryl-undecaprenol N-acetylglucosamine transferase [Agrobacterium tumefaciens]|nr:UDP-N-acetylglucosamine--N-acetylmuramyl-(pentapeptide) pyrophosphoryl-undecaprenol N-acetylglucosamine transferase [Agrobacterium tumefaciens]NTE22844.1 UDP-N-acetylglucosamine--N-acetylmuramyl-(pentapeptide) pyrophosphoryl-undecaprenol N-acetylglucosamine transferase [Agrobacterium tumefaciens]
MEFNLAFYVHHHGAGHFTRTAQIITHLAGFNITLLGSNLKPFAHLLPENIHVIHLPMDIQEDHDLYFQHGNTVDALHYAPLNVKGISDRVAIMTEFFRSARPLILVVDVSVEVTLLARLSGIPTIVMRQHGLRDDLPHQMAYQSAECLLAPFSASISPVSAKWIEEKTVYVGGFSRFYNRDSNTELKNHIAVIVGSGGTSINATFLKFLAISGPNFYFHIIGKIEGKQIESSNIKYYGHLDEPKEVLDKCYIVIGNTGHNTVMEMASLNKRFIGIPEARPFEEQVDKAGAISSISGVCIVLPESLYNTDWNYILTEIEDVMPNWKEVIAESALEDAANAIIAVGKSLYG